MDQSSKQSFLRVPLYIVSGIILSILLQLFNMPPALFILVFLVMCIGLASLIVWIEERIAYFTVFKPGDKVLIITGTRAGTVATVIERKAYTNLPYRVKFNDNNTAFYGRDELEALDN